MTKDEFKALWERNRLKRHHPCHRFDPAKIDLISSRDDIAALTEDGFLAWSHRFVVSCPGALVDAIPLDADAKALLQWANGDETGPPPKITEKPNAFYDRQEQRKREQEEREEELRKMRNSKLPYHLRKRVAGKDDV